MATPRLQLETLFVLDRRGRIVSTREPHPSPGPAFILIRGATELAWAVRADVSAEAADEFHRLARQEPAGLDRQRAPEHAARYRDLARGRVNWGPAFEFPERIDRPDGITVVRDEAPLRRHFAGWADGEIGAGAAPMMAVARDGHPVSVCFSARRSPAAAEAGLETARDFRGRGFAPLVASAWALAARGLGLQPLYSTEWENASSLAVARKLGLKLYATDWSIEG